MRKRTGSVQFASICQPSRTAVTNERRMSVRPRPRVRAGSKPPHSGDDSPMPPPSIAAPSIGVPAAVISSLPADRQPALVTREPLELGEGQAGEPEKDDDHGHE